VTKTITWLQARAENVAVGLLTVMFLSFILQIVFRYVLNNPLSWTLEMSLTTWLWLVFWGGAFNLKNSDHVRFDILYLESGLKVRRVLALVSAIAIVVGLLGALPATIDFISFKKIRTSSAMDIRLDYVFSVYLFFVVGVAGQYAIRAINVLRGRDPDASLTQPEKEPENQ
jgi:C4-dicarboxylate transporter, DctQ subunit